MYPERHALRFAVYGGLIAALASRRTWPKVNGAREPASESGPDVAANTDLSPTRVRACVRVCVRVCVCEVAARPAARARSSTWSRLLNISRRLPAGRAIDGGVAWIG